MTILILFMSKFVPSPKRRRIPLPGPKMPPHFNFSSLLFHPMCSICRKSRDIDISGTNWKLLRSNRTETTIIQDFGAENFPPHRCVCHLLTKVKLRPFSRVVLPPSLKTAFPGE